MDTCSSLVAMTAVIFMVFTVTSAGGLMVTSPQMTSSQDKMAAERKVRKGAETSEVTSAQDLGAVMTSEVTSSERRGTRRGWRPLQQNEACVKTGPCSCRSTGGVIDLSPLADNFTARYKDVLDTQGANLYSWNPCLSFTESDCVDVAACQLTPGTQRSGKAIGSQDTARFVADDSGHLTLQYTYPDPSGVNRTTIVTLVCDPDGDSAISVTGEMVAFQYGTQVLGRNVEAVVIYAYKF